MVHVYFDNPEDSEELASALLAEGYTVKTAREAFAGEDDAEDRSWVLVVGPDDGRIAEMVDVYGGWLPGEEHLAAVPMALPDQPKRLKND